MNTDTPETDAGVKIHRFVGGGPLELDGAFADVARNLERQRNEALQLARELRDALQCWPLKELLGKLEEDQEIRRSALTQLFKEVREDALTKATKLLP